MKKNLYYIDTRNRNNQILIFTNYKKAVQWCKKATCWDDLRIAQEIKIIFRIGENNHFNLFLNKQEEA